MLVVCLSRRYVASVVGTLHLTSFVVLLKLAGVLAYFRLLSVLAGFCGCLASLCCLFRCSFKLDGLVVAKGLFISLNGKVWVLTSYSHMLMGYLI